MELIKNILDKNLRRALFLAYSYKDGRWGLLRHMVDFSHLCNAPSENIEEDRFQKLKKILVHAYETTSFYSDLMKNIGFNPYLMRSIADMESMPIVTKQTIQDNKDTMVSRNYDKESLDISYTGGSSGTPTSFYRDKDCTTAKIGRQYGILDCCNYSIGMKRALIWGAHQDINPYRGSPRSLKYLIRNYALADETLSCTFMSEHDFFDYYKKLIRFKPEVLYGYPSAMTQFALYISQNNLKPLKVGTIISTAERLNDDQRAILKEVFHGDVFNLYCTREHGCIGFECEDHNGFHLDIGSVHIEVLEEGHSVKQGQAGDIIVTDLFNYGMPLIRYSVGDRGAFSDKPCTCGCNLPLLSSLEGRITDLLYRADGKKVSGIMLVDMFIENPVIVKMQIIQDTIKDIILNLVVTEDFNEGTRQYVVDRVKEYMGKQVKVHIHLVDDIPRNNNSGKHQEVINKLKI